MAALAWHHYVRPNHVPGAFCETWALALISPVHMLGQHQITCAALAGIHGHQNHKMCRFRIVSSNRNFRHRCPNSVCLLCLVFGKTGGYSRVGSNFKLNALPSLTKERETGRGPEELSIFQILLGNWETFRNCASHY